MMSELMSSNRFQLQLKPPRSLPTVCIPYENQSHGKRKRKKKTSPNTDVTPPSCKTNSSYK